MAENLPWDSQTDSFIDDIDKSIGPKYNVKLREILTNPENFIERNDARPLIESIREDVNKYFNTALAQLDDEKKKFESELESATLLYQQINSEISKKALASKFPFIKPDSIERKEDEDQRIVISQYSNSTSLLIDKMLSVSNFGADLSLDYKTYKIGSWLFSGQKNYLITINPPTSPVLDIENSNNVINSMLDDIESAIK